MENIALQERAPSRDLRTWQHTDRITRDQIKAWESWCEAGLGVAEAFKMSEWGPAVRGGAVATGQVVLQNVPVQPYVIDPGSFFAATEPNFLAAATFDYSAGGQIGPVPMPAIGIYAKLVIQFNGTITQTTAAGTPTSAYPYDLLQQINFTANGSDNLYSCSGMALKALEATRYPYEIAGGSFGELGDVPPAQASSILVGTTYLQLTWEVPFNMDEASMVGSVFAQARTLSMNVSGQMAQPVHLVTNTTGATVIAGTFTVGLMTYSVPVDGNGQSQHMVLPDLTFLHGFNANSQPITGLGQTRNTLNRVNGTLLRLFSQCEQTSTDPIAFYVPNGSNQAPAVNSGAVASYQLQFAGNKNPWNFNPAQFLVRKNVVDYGYVLPYAHVCLDLARYNAVRDAINLAGVTELYWLTNLQAGITAPSNGFSIVTAETLFA